jgi:hypothetical protein
VNGARSGSGIFALLVTAVTSSIRSLITSTSWREISINL